jgi:hypothetical protein
VINWVLEVGPQEARQVLRDPSGITSLRDSLEEIQEGLNPITKWVREEFIKAPKSLHRIQVDRRVKGPS